MQYTEIDIFDLPEMHQPILDKNKTVKLGTFFSGYDSQYMAMERLSKKGINTKFECISEIDKTALKVHRLLFGEIKNLGAVGSFEKIPPNLDIATWSFPCQDISLAGNQKGMSEGTRSNYGFVFLDTLENTPYHERPKVLLMENVKALASETFKNELNQIKERLKNCGYENHISILNAKNYLIPQNRERVFIVSILGGGYFEFPKPKYLTKILKDYLEKDVDESFYLNAKYLKIFTRKDTGNYPRSDRFLNNIYGSRNVANAITTRSGYRPTDNFILDPICINTKVDGKQPSLQNRIYHEEGISTAITTSYLPNILVDEGDQIRIPDASSLGYSLAEDGDGIYIDRPHQKCGVVQKDMIPTIKTQGHDIGIVEKSIITDMNHLVESELDDGSKIISIKNKAYIVSPSGKYFRVRKLTPREVLRLMDVEEKYIDIIVNNVSKTQVYKLAGNSIVVNVLVSIIEQLF